jgi:type II secretory pathway pseudopilin PulG
MTSHRVEISAMRRRNRAYTLLEIVIVLAIFTATVVGVLRLFSWTEVRANTQREQTSVSALVDAVQGIYATAPSYQGVDLTLVTQQSALDRVLRANGTPISAFGGALTLRAATVETSNDAFALEISQLNSKYCAAIIPALAGQSAQVSTTSGGNIQPRPDVVPDGGAIAKACSDEFFQQGQGTVTLVYYSPRATNASAATGPSCATSCAPRTESQTVACPVGFVGHLNQTRDDTCSTAACPVPVTGTWTTVSSSCAASPVGPPPPPVAPPPPGASCVPHVFSRTLGCPLPEVGGITQQQAITCAGGTQQVGPWTAVSSTCAAPPLPCVGGVLSGTDACPAGQGGQIPWTETMTCSGGGLAIGPKVPYGSSCEPGCIAAGTCCRPSTAPDGQKTVACAAGQYGQIIQTLKKSSTCASATAMPIWGPDVVASATGACAACPVPTTENQTVACPAGQVGSIEQSRSASYACASAPTALPAPTYSAWTTTSNTCAVAGCTPTGGGLWSVNVISMTTGPFNSTPTATFPIVTTGDRTVMKIGATTSRFLASGSITFDMTVGAQTQQFTVACTQANSTLNSPGNHITDECQYMGVVTLNGVSLNVALDMCGLVAQDWVNGSAVSCTSQVTIDQANCAAATVPQPVTNFEVGFWGGYWWHGIKPSDPSLGTCNAPVDGTNPTSGGSTGFNSFVLLNTNDGSADHYVVTMSRKGVTETVTIPAGKITKNATVSSTQPDGRAYWYQSWAGIFDAPTVYALTPDIDWSQYDYHDATANGGGGITITPDFRAATVSITACNAMDQCSVPTTQTNGVSIFSDGERDCQALSGGTVTPYPPTAIQ